MIYLKLLKKPDKGILFTFAFNNRINNYIFRSKPVTQLINQIRRIIPLCLIAAFVLSISCLRQEEFPDIPHIEYKDFIKINNGLGYDDKGILVLKFTDGDGDIGLAESDTFPPYDQSSMYYYNFFISYYEKQNGEFIEIELPFANNSRIPPLNSSKNPKPLKGEIEIELFINNFTSTYDTIRFSAFIVDRALNHSDTIITPDIYIVKP